MLLEDSYSTSEMFFFISSGAPLFRVLMVELVDTLDLDSSAREGVRVRLSVGALGMCKLFVSSLLVHAVYPLPVVAYGRLCSVENTRGWTYKGRHTNRTKQSRKKEAWK